MKAWVILLASVVLVMLQTEQCNYSSSTRNAYYDQHNIVYLMLSTLDDGEVFLKTIVNAVQCENCDLDGEVAMFLPYLLVSWMSDLASVSPPHGAISSIPSLS